MFIMGGWERNSKHENERAPGNTDEGLLVVDGDISVSRQELKSEKPYLRDKNRLGGHKTKRVDRVTEEVSERGSGPSPGHKTTRREIGGSKPLSGVGKKQIILHREKFRGWGRETTICWRVNPKQNTKGVHMSLIQETGPGTCPPRPD